MFDARRALPVLRRDSPDGDPAEHGTVVELAADRDAGADRQMLVDSLWRVKTDGRARSFCSRSMTDVTRHAIHALRRAYGNDEARQRLAPLREYPDGRVRVAARDALKRMERS